MCTSSSIGCLMTEQLKNNKRGNMAPMQTNWYKTCLLVFLYDQGLISCHKRATCPGPSPLSCSKLSPRVNYGWWQMKGRKEVKKSVALNCYWFIPLSLFLFQKVTCWEGGGAEVQKNPPPPPRLYWVCCHFPPIVQFEWGRGAKHSGKLYSTHCVYILFFPF